MVDSESDLEARLRTLFHKFIAAQGAAQLAELQKALALEIIATEEACDVHRHDKDIRRGLKDHIHACRVIGDAIAWQFLSPHMIRELYNNDGNPPFLKNQREATDSVLAAIEDIAKSSGMPAVAADLTHILKIGDVIMPGNANCPRIIEFKKSAAKIETANAGNRCGRQMLRMHALGEYLLNDRGKLFDDEFERIVLGVATEAQHNWDVVDRACCQAIDEGWAFNVVSNCDVICCLRNDHEISDLPQSLERPDFKEGMVGAHCRYLDREVSPYVPPVLTWPIGVREREALFLRDINLIHIIDPTGIVGFENSDVRIVEFVPGECAYKVETPFGSGITSDNWLTWWIYGFQTSDSLCYMLAEFALQSMRLIHNELGGSK